MTIDKVTLLLTAIMSGATATESVALEGPGRALIASNVLKLSADTQRSGLIATKEFIVPYAGVVRLRYQFKSDGGGPQTVSVTVTTAIDFNNSSCNASTSATTFQSKACDVKVVAGDRLRVNAAGLMDFNPPFAQSSVFLRNVRLFWNVVDSTGTGAVLLD